MRKIVLPEIKIKKVGDRLCMIIRKGGYVTKKWI